MKSPALRLAVLSLTLLLFLCPGASLLREERWTDIYTVVAEGGETYLAQDQSEPPVGPRGSVGKKVVKRTLQVLATAYHADPDQTDDTPTICAWGDEIQPGTIAVSRDLERIGLTRGKIVFVEGLGRFTVLDRMHERKRRQIDIFMGNNREARKFGVQRLTIRWQEPLDEQPT
jgi:3D (Asp-Asp-Asp) domain-containing protein